MLYQNVPLVERNRTIHEMLGNCSKNPEIFTANLKFEKFYNFETEP